jgi:hypothetical protein
MMVDTVHHAIIAIFDLNFGFDSNWIILDNLNYYRGLVSHPLD